MYPASLHPPGSLSRKKPKSRASKVQQLLLLATALVLYLIVGHGAAAYRDTDVCADSQTLALALLSKDVQHVRIAGEQNRTNTCPALGMHPVFDSKHGMSAIPSALVS